MNILQISEAWNFNMDFIFGIFLVMGAALLALIKTNNNLRSKDKLKDLEIADTKLQAEQDTIKKQKDDLKKELENPKIKKEQLTDKEIEEFWKGKKGR
jgi:hypothetical protein